MPDPPPPAAPRQPDAPTQADASRTAAAASALAALDGLAELGVTIEDEWTYVMALAEAGRTRIRAAAGSGTAASLAPDRAAAIAEAAAEVARIEDAHRAIDWLSTFPAIVELALGGAAAPDGSAASDKPAASGGRS
jgi:hypothetical protein